MPTLQFSTHLGEYSAAVEEARTGLRQADILNRIRHIDHTVWHPEPTEISNRLGWVTSPHAMQAETADLAAFTAEITAAGYTHVLLLGMGGSSLAPELFSLTFGGAAAGLQLGVVDTTAPETMSALAASHDPATTLFVVATKSGGTVETLSAFKYFYNWVAAALGTAAAGAHFVAITDPGSSLVKLADQYQFRRVFLNDPNIGGRYSVLSHFGLVPAALVGVDVPRLLDSAVDMTTQDDLCAHMGAIMAILAQHGRDKLTFVTPPALASFGDWAEQLVAESVGKNGMGILPVVGEPLGPPAVYGADRLFVSVTVAGDETAEPALAALAAAGHPVIRFILPDVYALGGQFFLWEMATAVAGHLLGIQPFDQPNVEFAKIAARQMVAAYHETGTIPASESAAVDPTTLANFVAQASAGDYIALQAYVPPTAASMAQFRALQAHLRDQTKLAVTFGFGPRFLHSTGQLHKGDAGRGLFVQFTYTPAEGADVAIPDSAASEASAMSFGVLILTQALGDGQALRDAGRRVMRFHITGDVNTAVATLL